MAEPSSGRTDCWADWLLRGRQRGLSATQQARVQRQLRRLRDRVLRDARLRAGQRLLDVGAGTGLIALEALRRVGPTGAVVALDLSRDALVRCGTDAAAAGEQGTLHLVPGDAVRLPVADQRFDAVTLRSVLIYVAEKEAAVEELYRVLRPGGRVSLFEPINRAMESAVCHNDLDLSSIQPAHDRVVAQLRADWPHRETMLGFDERDLAGWFVAAGFRDVRLSYQYTSALQRRSPQNVLTSIRPRPNPTMASYEEGARAVLGDAADAHLAAYVRLVSSQPSRSIWAGAYLTARR